MNRLQQFIQKHNINITRHDRLYYGKYYYSLKLILKNNSTGFNRYVYGPFEHQRMHLINKYNVFLRIEAGILTLYSKTTDELLDSYALLKDLFSTKNNNYDLRVEKLSECPANITKKPTRLRKSLPYNAYETEVILRKRRGNNLKKYATLEQVKNFCNMYPDKTFFSKGKSYSSSYTVWLTDRSLLPVVYLYFVGAVQRANQYYIEGDKVNET